MVIVQLTKVSRRTNGRLVSIIFAILVDANDCDSVNNFKDFEDLEHSSYPYNADHHTESRGSFDHDRGY